MTDPYHTEGQAFHPWSPGYINLGTNRGGKWYNLTPFWKPRSPGKEETLGTKRVIWLQLVTKGKWKKNCDRELWVISPFLHFAISFFRHVLLLDNFSHFAISCFEHTLIAPVDRKCPITIFEALRTVTAFASRKLTVSGSHSNVSPTLTTCS